MLISELSFPHLQAAHDERLAQELERRRVVQERLAEQGAGRSRGRAARLRRRRRASGCRAPPSWHPARVPRRPARPDGATDRPPRIALSVVSVPPHR